jgi:hypothetical protein
MHQQIILKRVQSHQIVIRHQLILHKNQKNLSPNKITTIKHRHLINNLPRKSTTT